MQKNNHVTQVPKHKAGPGGRAFNAKIGNRGCETRRPNELIKQSLGGTVRDIAPRDILAPQPLMNCSYLSKWGCEYLSLSYSTLDQALKSEARGAALIDIENVYVSRCS